MTFCFPSLHHLSHLLVPHIILSHKAVSCATSHPACMLQKRKGIRIKFSLRLIALPTPSLVNTIRKSGGKPTCASHSSRTHLTIGTHLLRLRHPHMETTHTESLSFCGILPHASLLLQKTALLEVCQVIMSHQSPATNTPTGARLANTYITRSVCVLT